MGKNHQFKRTGNTHATHATHATQATHATHEIDQEELAAFLSGFKTAPAGPDLDHVEM
jgi:hypothetical protein